jgi:DNA-directed RNA polymerase specialized sigma24 family protein
VSRSDDLPWVYGAALAAARSSSAAERITEHVVLSCSADASRARRIGEAVRLAVGTAPAPPYDRLAPGAREALALVRLAGLRVDEVAALLGEDERTVKRRLAEALRTLASGAVPARA